jgi:uncharacterized membrane protein
VELIGLVILAVVVGFPIAAFVALSRTSGLSRDLATLHRTVEQLRGEIADLRRRIAEGIVPELSASTTLSAATIKAAAPIAEPAGTTPAMTTTSIELGDEATVSPPPSAAEPVGATAPAPLTAAPAGVTPRALEERIGSRVFVWVGGVALALAGAFLVKYSIDAGLLGPGVRVGLGIALGIVLLAAGEFMHSRSMRIAQALSAAGAACLFASLFAAVSLYHLLAPSLGFALLAAVTAGTISLSLRQGPFIGLVGLAGGFLTPAIVGSEEPDAAVLFNYLFLLQLGTQILARRRAWWWLAAVAVSGGMLWVLLWLDAFHTLPVAQRIWGLLFLTASAGLAVWSVRGVVPAEQSHGNSGFRYTAGGAIAASVSLAALAVAVHHHAPLEWLFFGLLAAFVLVLARLREDAEMLGALAAGLGLLVLATWPEPFESDLSAAFVVRFATTSTALGTLFALGGFVGLWGAQRKIRWAIFSAVSSALFFLVAYGRLRNHGGLPPWGFVSLLLAALHLAAAERVARYRATATEYRQALGVFALAVTGFIALAVPLELEHDWMAVAWSLQLPAIAWVEKRLDIPWLRHSAWVFGALVLIRLCPVPLIFQMPLGDTPILNWLLYGYGIPLAGFIAAAVIFRRRADDHLVTALEAGAAVIGFVLVSLEIRHAFHGADMAVDALGLGELGSLSIAWILIGLALLAASVWQPRPALLWGGRVSLVIGALALLVGGLLAANPLFNHLSVATFRIANLLVPTYAIPALLMLGAARMFERRVEDRQALAAGCFAIVLGFAFVSLEVRQWFQGEFLDGSAPNAAETYAYSAAWLVYGVLLLAGGIVTRGRALRYASLGVVVIAVCKVFLFDAAALTGLYRVASFLGLGLSLMTIGYVYQRVVFRSPAEPVLPVTPPPTRS